MMKYLRLEPRFVEYIPEKLQAGILYVSMTYATAAHACCCGCGMEVVTPLAPTDWKLTFDGETVSLRPSIGNWNLPCRSHYVIDRGSVVEAEPWSDRQVAAERARDRHAKAQYYDTGTVESVSKIHIPKQSSNTIVTRHERFWSRITRWLQG